VYDREERSRLAVEQGKFTETHFIKPNQTLLAQWSAEFVL
ncbi:putative oxygenase MesX, partial [Bacillus subtilis]